MCSCVPVLFVDPGGDYSIVRVATRLLLSDPAGTSACSAAFQGSKLPLVPVQELFRVVGAGADSVVEVRTDFVARETHRLELGR
jgi:hypothetical protein